METVNTFGRTFTVFAPLNGTDIFQVIMTQPSSEAQLHPTYQQLISTVRCID